MIPNDFPSLNFDLGETADQLRASVRGFTADEDGAPGTYPVAVVSYHLWQERLNADPAVLGRKIVVDGLPFTIVGSIANRSHEHINIQTFISDLERELTSSHRVTFVAGKGELDSEQRSVGCAHDQEFAGRRHQAPPHSSARSEPGRLSASARRFVFACR